MAFHSKVSCMAAQLVLEQVSRTDADALALTLQGDVRRAVWSKNANHVLQKIIDILHVEKTKFIIDEIIEAGPEVTRHVFGLPHQKHRIVDAILPDLSTLAKD